MSFVCDCKSFMAVNPQFIASPLNTFLIVRYVLVTLCWMSHIMWSGNYWNLVNWCVVVIDVSVLKVSSTSGESLWKYDFCHLHWFWKCTLCFWLLSFYAINAYIALYLYIWLFICCLLAMSSPLNNSWIRNCTDCCSRYYYRPEGLSVFIKAALEMWWSNLTRL